MVESLGDLGENTSSWPYRGCYSVARKGRGKRRDWGPIRADQKARSVGGGFRSCVRAHRDWDLAHTQKDWLWLVLLLSLRIIPQRSSIRPYAFKIWAICLDVVALNFYSSLEGPQISSFPFQTFFQQPESQFLSFKLFFTSTTSSSTSSLYAFPRFGTPFFQFKFHFSLP